MVSDPLMVPAWSDGTTTGDQVIDRARRLRIRGRWVGPATDDDGRCCRVLRLASQVDDDRLADALAYGPHELGCGWERRPSGPWWSRPLAWLASVVAWWPVDVLVPDGEVPDLRWAVEAAAHVAEGGTVGGWRVEVRWWPGWWVATATRQGIVVPVRAGGWTRHGAHVAVMREAARVDAMGDLLTS